MAQHRPVRRLMPMIHPRGKCVQHPLRHRASTHYSFPSSAAARQNSMANGPIFTNGKSSHCFAIDCSLTLVSLPNTKYLTPVPPRQHPDPAHLSCLPSRELTSKRCPVNPFLPHRKFVDGKQSWARNPPSSLRGGRGGCRKPRRRSWSGASWRARDEADARRRRGRPGRCSTSAWWA